MPNVSLCVFEESQKWPDQSIYGMDEKLQDFSENSKSSFMQAIFLSLSKTSERKNLDEKKSLSSLLCCLSPADSLQVIDKDKA